MAALNSHEIVAMFLALGVLLASARFFGELARALRQPSVVGEIFAGILLGPTILGAVSPGWVEFLFPRGGGSALGLIPCV